MRATTITCKKEHYERLAALSEEIGVAPILLLLQILAGDKASAAAKAKDTPGILFWEGVVELLTHLIHRLGYLADTTIHAKEMKLEPYSLGPKGHC